MFGNGVLMIGTKIMKVRQQISPSRLRVGMPIKELSGWSLGTRKPGNEKEYVNKKSLYSVIIQVWEYFPKRSKPRYKRHLIILNKSVAVFPKQIVPYLVYKTIF